MFRSLLIYLIFATFRVRSTAVNFTAAISTTSASYPKNVVVFLLIDMLVVVRSTNRAALTRPCSRSLDIYYEHQNYQKWFFIFFDRMLIFCSCQITSILAFSWTHATKELLAYLPSNKISLCTVHIRSPALCTAHRALSLCKYTQLSGGLCRCLKVEVRHLSLNTRQEFYYINKTGWLCSRKSIQFYFYCVISHPQSQRAEHINGRKARTSCAPWASKLQQCPGEPVLLNHLNFSASSRRNWALLCECD